MRIIDEPKVILVARPSIVKEGITELMGQYGLGPEGWKRGDGDGDGDGIPELMGRLCYGSFGPRQGRISAHDYLDNILANGHGSVMEHGNWSFIIVGASRGYTHQQVRHRAGFAYSQESSHFIDYSVDGEVGTEGGICVVGIPGDALEAFIGACRMSLEAYRELWTSMRGKGAKKKIASGTVRGLLPCAIESKLGMTGNARALRHFCQLRGTPDNTLEIRLVAVQVARIMKKEAPSTFKDFSEVVGEDGWPVVKSKWIKV